MVVICPKCKVRLKVADEKIVPGGSRFKCPKCSTVLLVKKPVPAIRPLDKNKVLVAHEDPSVVDRIKAILSAEGYKVVTVNDGIEAMVNAARELPYLAILGVSLPKIYGFEVCRRLKNRPETRDMKVILIAALYDRKRYRREPGSLHGADDYIEEHQLEESLIGKINALKGIVEKVPEEAPKGLERPLEGRAGEMETEETKAAEEGPQRPPTVETDEMIEKAKRLARTIISDIYLYSKAKVDDAIRNNTFHTAFASELKEGTKLYENRVPSEIRRLGDFFNEAINNFIEQRRRELIQYS
ncbi:MAG: response regulator [Thermodesulfovibrionales bacterium]